MVDAMHLRLRGGRFGSGEEELWGNARNGGFKSIVHFHVDFVSVLSTFMWVSCLYCPFSCGFRVWEAVNIAGQRRHCTIGEARSQARMRNDAFDRHQSIDRLARHEILTKIHEKVIEFVDYFVSFRVPRRRFCVWRWAKLEELQSDDAQSSQAINPSSDFVVVRRFACDEVVRLPEGEARAP